jgi:glycosyltransferase involved in cell wall biosynthesis
MKNISIEGWRFIPHSYSVANQFQCLEFLKRSDIQIYHKDVAYYRESWQPATGLFSESQEAALKSIPSAPPDNKVDAVFRITYPYDLTTSNAHRTCVFGTSEMMQVPDRMLTSNSPLNKTHLDSNCIIITPSNWSRAGFLRGGADPNRVVVTPLGVDTSIFKPLAYSERQKLRAELGWDGFVFLNLGAMTSNKGVQFLLKAFASIVSDYPDARLVLKGLDSLYSSEDLLVQTVGELTYEEADKVMERLIYVGDTLPFSKVAQLYQAADAYVSPYLAEGFNMPVLESISCGLPVICTKGGPTDDFTTPMSALYIDSTLHETQLEQDYTGFLLVPDFDHLIELMKQVIEDQSFVTQARKMGHEFVETHFTWRSVVDQLLDVLIQAP